MKSDTTEMTRRMADAAILDKLKYMREVNFFEGTDLAHMGNREAWEKSEAEISKRYSKDALHAIRRNGYSGLSVQRKLSACWTFIKTAIESQHAACIRSTPLKRE